MLAGVGITGPAWLNSKDWAMPGIVMAAVWKDTGYYALMVLAALKSIDSTCYEAADIDGASGFKKLTAITLPLISPTLFFLIVINIIYGLQVFDSVLIMTNGVAAEQPRFSWNAFISTLSSSTRWDLPARIPGFCSR